METKPVRLRSDMTVTVIGLGLMGGSLCLALREQPDPPRLIGVVRSAQSAAWVRDQGVVDEVTTDVRAGVRDADVVILATPVRTLIRQIALIGPHLKPHAVVMDLGSTKGQICRALEQLPEHVQPVGGHPMCGKEKAGLEHADPRLYRDATFVLCPLERTADWALALAQDLVVRLGARPLILSPDLHDRLVATISHLPYLVAVTLVQTAHRVAQEDPRVWRVAASGFRDTTRVASSDVKMMMDILLTNREAVLEMLDIYREELDALRALLDQEAEGPLRLHLSNIKNLRDAHMNRGDGSEKSGRP
ncbi:MAG: prephenate dehydrogenase/arogenate dehydrogenase family protein [Chloroflexi bacterium]|nr:prephenate dehydrogenase/arogenate dehydrogenase family protein [Chloroflexota bacterium]